MIGTKRSDKFGGFGRIAMILLFSFSVFSCTEKKGWTLSSEETKLKVEVVGEDIAIPFGMAFLPDGRMLVTNRPERNMVLLDTRTGRKKMVKGLPDMDPEASEGILDVLVHPDFVKNNLIFLAYALHDDQGSSLAVESFRLSEDSLSQGKRVFIARPYFEKYNYFGSRLLVKDGFLYITTGVSKKYQDSAQRLTNDQGKIIRVKEDGAIPDDNPFIHSKGALPEIYCLGTRNAQGMTLNPFTQEIWMNEHGPKGGDEVNIVKSGANYGWPVISNGLDYDDTPVGTGKAHHEGMEDPIYQYTPSIAPSGMVFYTGDAFPMWKGNLFIGAMKLKHLNRLIIKDNKVVHEERLLKELDYRVRNVIQGPDGFLYIGVDGGRILRIRPV